MSKAPPPFSPKSASDPILYESLVSDWLAYLDHPRSQAELEEAISHRDLRVVLKAVAHPDLPLFVQKSLLEEPSSLLGGSGDANAWYKIIQLSIAVPNPQYNQDLWYKKRPFGRLPHDLIQAALTRSPSLSHDLLTELYKTTLFTTVWGQKLVNILDIESLHSVRPDVLMGLMRSTLLSPQLRSSIATRFLSRPSLSDETMVDVLLYKATLPDAPIDIAQIDQSATLIDSLRPRLLLLSNPLKARLLASHVRPFRLQISQIFYTAPKRVF